MNILWSTTFRPFLKSEKNNDIQLRFIRNIKNLKQNVELSITQFDDQNVIQTLDKFKVKYNYYNYSKKKLPRNAKYSNKIVLSNSIKFYLKKFNSYKYFVYSTVDITFSKKIFSHIENKYSGKKDTLYIVFPNTLIVNGKSNNVPIPYFGIDIFIFNLSKSKLELFNKLLESWEQYDWGIIDNFFIAVADHLKLEIVNLYKDFEIVKYENPFNDFKESREWQIRSWKNNSKFFFYFLKKNKISLLYHYGSYYFIAFKIFNFKDLSFKLLFSYFLLAVYLIKNLLKKILFIK